MSSEDNFDDQPLPVVNEKDAAKAFNAEHVFERSSAAPATVIPSVASIDEFPDEPEPQTEPMPEPQALDAEFVEPASSYGISDPASLAAAGTGELHDPELVAQQVPEIAQATLEAASDPEAPCLVLVPSSDLLASQLSLGKVLQPHLAHLAQVGLTNSDTWNEEIKPRIENLQGQILEINDRLDHLTTQKYR
ncbi:MAG: hypothetical protein RIR92_1210 [Pseudomonadota bacterium]|jgi:hypothetical protein